MQVNGKMRAVVAILSVAIVTGATSCRKETGDNRPVLVVSLEPQRFWLEQLAGDDYRIVALMPNGSNPESFEPSTSGRVDVENCEAYFSIGYLPFEETLMLSSSNREAFVNTSEGIEPIYGTHDEDNNHSTFLPGEEGEKSADPHVWTSVRNARVMTKAMADKLMEIDPDNAEEYRERYEAFDSHLDSLDRAYAKRFESLDNKAFLVWHPSLSYFARDYGLEQIAVSSETKEVSAQSLKNIISEAVEDSVKVFFYQRDYDSRQADAISTGVGSRLVPVNPGTYDWETELNQIVDALTQS